MNAIPLNEGLLDTGLFFSTQACVEKEEKAANT